MKANIFFSFLIFFEWLPGVDELDNIVLKQKLVHNILPHEERQTELQDILDRCKEITDLNCIQVHWRS
jgi:hypothetical protein